MKDSVGGRMAENDLTVVIPVKNELKGLSLILPELLNSCARVIVVDDGSSDGSAKYAEDMGAFVIRHRKSKGNGAAVKSGLACVKTKYAGLMDGDGQHSVASMLELYRKASECEADLVVGSRNRKGQASALRFMANTFYNKFASWMVSDKVEDLTSGQRVFLTEKVKPILWMLPNKFSYPTTSTMVFYRLGYDVLYIPVNVSKRVGEDSHINLLRDGFRFLLIIMRVGTLFSPFKLFVPISGFLFLAGLGRYIFTFLSYGTFTNMSALLLVSSVIVFLMGVLSEQVSMTVFSGIK